ncbi:hypothetical protein MHL31_02970 [Lutibacter sp. A80]|uniref:hypothetical protein n=1 Tax=Lutibacter sp. A80 TaxID=2918453 RepID=UPI001F068440|nr:hypothetical protein [Lutibacter sp. A80]UMB61175.1 hypothetical protein MHL31_02970 [Lutibacter sp. A80]
MKNYVLFFLLISLTSCDKYSNKENTNTYDIINLIAKNSPSSHPFKSGRNKNFDISKYYIDNHFIVAVQSMMEPIGKTIGMRDENRIKYGELFENLRTLQTNEYIKIDKIDLFDDVKFIALTDKHIKNMKGKCEFDDFHLYLSFSRIAFNSNYNQAIVGVGTAVSCLAGDYGMYILKKEKGQWKIEKYILKEIS